MSRRKFEADRDNLPESPIQEEEESLPDLIIERVPKRKSDDESEIYYYLLRKKMTRYCRFLFNKEKDGSNSSDFEDILNKPGPDDSVESNMNRLFMENFKVYNNGLNKNASDNINDTVNLEDNQPDDHVRSKYTEDENEQEIVLAAKETMETEEMKDKRKEKSRSASSDAVSTEEYDQSHSEPRSSLNFNIDLKSDRTSSESLILPTRYAHQERLLKKHDESKQSDGVISQIKRRKVADEEDIKKTEAMESDNAKYNEQCVKSSNSGIIERQPKEKVQSIDKENSKNIDEKGSYQLTDRENAGRFARNIIEKYDNVMMDPVEVMRGQNFLPSSTQSLNGTSNYSFSTQTFDLKRRDEIMIRHSIESERESMELDILASRPMDITETASDDFYRFMRCSTPICVDREHRDKHFDVHSNPVDHDMSTNEIATVQHSPPIHNVPSTTKETDVPETQNFKDVAAQTDMIIEKDKVLVDIGVQVDDREKNVSSVYMQTDEHKVLVDIGVQVEERENNVRSVHVQTEEHENLDSLVSQRLFRRGNYNFFFL